MATWARVSCGTRSSRWVLSRVLLGSRLMACWRNDLGIRGRNTIGNYWGWLAALSQDTQWGQASVFQREIPGVLAQHETPSGQGRGFGARQGNA